MLIIWTGMSNITSIFYRKLIVKIIVFCFWYTNIYEILYLLSNCIATTLHEARGHTPTERAIFGNVGPSSPPSRRECNIICVTGHRNHRVWENGARSPKMIHFSRRGMTMGVMFVQLSPGSIMEESYYCQL